MDLQAIANSTFNSENSVNGFHTLKLTISEHKALKDALLNNVKGEITCDCQLGNECEGCPNGELCCSYKGDPQTKIIWDLKEEIKKLKESDEKSMSLCEKQNEKFMDQLEEKDDEIADLKKKLEEQRLESVKYFNERDILKRFLKGEIDHKLNDAQEHIDHIGQITISSGKRMGEFYVEKLHDIIDECIKEMTTWESHGCGPYSNGYWYDNWADPNRYTLQHSSGTICYDIVESDDEGSEGFDSIMFEGVKYDRSTEANDYNHVYDDGMHWVGRWDEANGTIIFH